MKRLALVTALLVGLVGNAHAGAAPQETTAKPHKDGNACLFVRSVRHYRSLDRDSLVIWGPGRNAYLVELSMPLFGLDGSWEMAVIDNDRDGRLCGFSMDRIGVKDFGRPDSASIRSMTRLDEAGLAALEEQYKVTLTRKKKGEQKPS